MPKVTVEDKVLAILKSNVWVGSDQIEALFPKGEPGHFSWPQRLRGLREPQNGGYTITHRIKAGTKKLTEWHIEAPKSPILGDLAHTEAPISPKVEIDIPLEAPKFLEKGKQLCFIG